MRVRLRVQWGEEEKAFLQGLVGPPASRAEAEEPGPRHRGPQGCRGLDSEVAERPQGLRCPLTAPTLPCQGPPGPRALRGSAPFLPT